MQLIPSKQVREGQTVAREVRSENGKLLLSRGQRLTSSLIQRLFKFRIEAIYVRDGFGDAEPELVRAEIKQQCQQILSNSFNNVAAEAEAKRIVLDAQAVQAVSDTLLDALLSARDPLVTLLDISTSSDRMMQHSVNVTVLATLLGIELNLSTQMLRDLAVGMLFHDIGMTLLPEELTQKPGGLTSQDVHQLRTHVSLGFEHLTRMNAVNKVAANVVLRHHETMNGTGYPQGVTGDKLSLLARIASVAEVYDSLTTVRFSQPAIMPDAALTYILQNTGKLFAKEVVLALCKRVALYPTGTAVLLNTGESGIVAGTEPTAPMRPRVTIHFDMKLTRRSPLLIDLTQDRGRFVVRSAPNIQLLHKNRAPLMPPQQVNPTFASI